MKFTMYAAAAVLWWLGRRDGLDAGKRDGYRAAASDLVAGLGRNGGPR